MPGLTSTFDEITSGGGGLVGVPARFALALAAVPYRAAIALNNFTYDRGWQRVTRVERPVISVGNISLGGTGKTPMVEWVSRRLRAVGWRVTLLSRGYGASTGLNDEGRVLDQNLPDVPHLQGRDRVALARIAIDELDAQVLVLDDGFQHRRLARDLDIVLLDALDPFGRGRLFPRGRLREPLAALRRAHVVVLSRADMVDAGIRRSIRARVERHAGGTIWAEARHAPRDCIDTHGTSDALATLDGRPVAAFCGIGNPDGFRRTLATLNVAVSAFRPYDDHHDYTRADVDDLARWLAASGADLALTTQKDLVKLRVATLAGLPLRALRVGLELIEGGPRVEEALTSAVPGTPGD